MGAGAAGGVPGGLAIAALTTVGPAGARTDGVVAAAPPKGGAPVSPSAAAAVLIIMQDDGKVPVCFVLAAWGKRRGWLC
eukprot:scaffold139895_cov12-Tisochrysis_lutea.AAC.1